MKTINNEKKELIHEAVKRLKGYERREYQAYIALEYFQGNARRTEYAMGWGREMLILREALIKDKGYSDKELPCENTIGNILNRLGYNLKRVLKAKPAKKIKEVDEIFENVWRVNKESDNNPNSLRISIDAKAKLNIGNFSRGGKSRDAEAKKAEDHDMNPIAKLVPYGILNVLTGYLTFFSELHLRLVTL